MNINKDINTTPSFEDFQKNPPKKGSFGKIMFLSKAISFIWSSAKNIFLIYLAYKTFC